jgi:hypothetical protein
MRRGWPVALLLWLFAGIGHADAADGCTFAMSDSAQRWTLTADCVTDEAIVVPDGVTLDGGHHTILAIDPEGGTFRGGIITTSGTTATVIDTVLSALRLTDVCQTGSDRLRAIYFNGASGLIQGNTILNVNKARSACQEGNGIEVRNVNLGGLPARVDVVNNVVEGFQKSGIVASGNVDVAIRSNSVGPSAAQRLLVANGIQAGAGARAVIEANAVAGNSWPGDGAAATAILLVDTAPGTVVRGNVIGGNADVGIYVMANGVRVELNRLTDTGSDGAFDVGIGNYGEDNVFDRNSITGYYQRYQNVSEPAAGSGTVASSYPSR